MNLSKIMRTILDYLLIIPIALLPQHFLSRQIHKLTRIELVWFKHAIIKGFCRLYPIKLNEAVQADIRVYQNFNDFFTRALKPDARPIGKTRLISPVDGAVSECGDIKVDLLYQAKNFYYDLKGLVGGNEAVAEDFFNGQFATIYLAPKDYHRIHMPCDGELLQTTYVPGRLYPVNNPSVRTVPNLFSKNERLVCIFETDYGKMAMILIGAMFVGSIETVWQGEVTPPHLANQVSENYQKSGKKGVVLKKGEEMGRFNMGSTVVLLFDENFTKLTTSINQVIKVGHEISGV